MALWLAFAVIAALTVAALLRPLLRGDEAALDPQEADLAVYRDQLSEIDAEREQGLMGAAEAEAARAELARRMIARAERDKADPGKSGAVSAVPRAAVQALAAIIPVAAIGLYALYGSPAMPDRPFAERARQTQDKASVAELVAKVEARLAEHPEEAQGWDVLGPVYMMQQRFPEAIEAFKKAIALAGETPKRLAGIAEASLAQSNGIVTEDARKAFERLIAIDPKRAEARFWLAIAKEQDGKLAAAAEDLEQLLKDFKLDDAARKATEERLAGIRGRLGPRATAGAGAPAAAAAPAAGPDPAAVAAMPESERAAFVERMVSSLAERLKKDGKDVQGWVKLVRAYKVLGREAEAKAALADARRALAGETSALAELDAAARSLGLGT